MHNHLEEIPGEEEGSRGAACNHILENVSEVEEGGVLPSLEHVCKIAEALTAAEVDAGKLHALTNDSDSSLEVVRTVLEDGLECCHTINGLEAVEAYLSLAKEIINAVNQASSALRLSPDIEVDDYEVQQKQHADGSNKETHKKLKGTMKEMIRSLRASVPLMKLMAADPKVREYLLYCAISLSAAMG